MTASNGDLRVPVTVFGIPLMQLLRAASLVLAISVPCSLARADEPAEPPPTLDQAHAYIKAGYYVLAASELQRLGEAMTPADRVKSLPAVAAIVTKFPAARWLYAGYKDVSLDAPSLDAPTREAALFQLGLDDVTRRLDENVPYGTPPPDRSGKLRLVQPASPYRQRATLLIAKEAMLRGRPEGVLEPVRELLDDKSRAAEAVRVLAEWRLDAIAFVGMENLPRDAHGEEYNAHLARTVAELQRIAKTNAAVADSAKFHIELIRLERTVMDMQMVPGIALEQVVIASVCTSGPTTNVLPRVAATIRDTRAFVKRVWVSEEYADLEGQLRQTREQASTDAGAALVWLAITAPDLEALAAPDIEELRAWHAEAARELTTVKSNTLDQREQLELVIRESELSSDIAKVYRDRISRLESDLSVIERTLGSAARNYRAIESRPLEIAAGTAGLEVAFSSCPGEEARPAMSKPTAPVTRTHGCAGCDTTGSATGWLAIGLLLALQRRRRA